MVKKFLALKIASVMGLLMASTMVLAAHECPQPQDITYQNAGGNRYCLTVKNHHLSWTGGCVQTSGSLPPLGVGSLVIVALFGDVNQTGPKVRGYQVSCVYNDLNNKMSSINVKSPEGSYWVKVNENHLWNIVTTGVGGAATCRSNSPSDCTFH